jgi:kinesin family protein 20
MPKPPHIYSFDRVFGPSSSQSDFFANTTLPLVDQLLKGENGLLFAYGVSNSGKTYSVTGGNTINSADRGVLPRAIDVVFRSISGLESTASVSLHLGILISTEMELINSFVVKDWQM